MNFKFSDEERDLIADTAHALRLANVDLVVNAVYFFAAKALPFLGPVARPWPSFHDVNGNRWQPASPADLLLILPHLLRYEEEQRVRASQELAMLPPDARRIVPFDGTSTVPATPNGAIPAPPGLAVIQARAEAQAAAYRAALAPAPRAPVAPVFPRTAAPMPPFSAPNTAPTAPPPPHTLPSLSQPIIPPGTPPGTFVALPMPSDADDEQA